MNILITGANGFIGSNVVEKYIEMGYNVFAFIREDIKNSRFNLEKMYDRVNIIWGQLEDYKLIESVINDYEINSIIHLGAQTIVSAALRMPLRTLETNVVGTWNILEAARKNDTNLKSIIIASSDKAYGRLNKDEYHEDDCLKGDAPYDVSKTCADLIAQMYLKTYDLPIGISRCSNVYGPGDLNLNRLIPETIISLLKGNDPIIRSNGEYVRDYTYVDDIANSYVLLEQYIRSGKNREHIFNFSSEEKYSVIEIVNMLIQLMGSNKKPKIVNTAVYEIPYQHLDSKKARKILGWECNTQIKDGLKKTIEWYSAIYGGDFYED